MTASTPPAPRGPGGGVSTASPETSPVTAGSAPPGRAGAALAAATLLVLLPPWLARNDSSNWTWGLNIVRYLPPGAAMAAFALGLAALALGTLLAARPISRAAPAPGGTGAGRAPRDPREFFSARGLPWQFLLCAFAAVAFWTWREQAHFLSDTVLRLRTMYRMAMGGRDVAAWILHAAPLDYQLTVMLPVHVARAGLLTIFQAGQLVLCLIGAGFVAVAIRAAALTAESTRGRLLVLAVLLTQGYIELFAGYCKGYGLLLTLLLGWYVAALGEERAGRGPVWSTVLFGLALLTHRTALLLLPAQAISVWRARRPGGGRAWPGLLALVFASACAVALALSWRGVVSRDLQLAGQAWLRSPGPGDSPLFSAVNAAHVLNALMLVAPAGLAGVILLPFVRPARPVGRTLLVAGAPFVLMALLVGTRYALQGAPRDWDIFASCGLFLALAAAGSVSAAVERAPRLAPLAAALVLASALHTGTWLYLNATESAALARVDAVGRGSPPLPLSARAMLFEYLGEIRELDGQPALSADAYLEAASLAPNPRFFILAGSQLWSAGQRARAAEAFRRAALRDPVTRQKMLVVSGQALARDPADSMHLAMRDAALSVTVGAP